MPTYTHPQDPFLKNLHYAMEYANGKPSIRVSGGGGGGSSAPQPVDIATISATTIPLPINASTETTLQQVKDAILGQTAIASTLWTDDSGAFYVRKDIVDQETGAVTVTFTDPTGAPATPGTGLKPVSSDTNTQTETTYYTATANGTGYSTNDLIARLIILNTSTSPATIKSTVWVNMTAGTTMSAAPANANIIKTTNDVVINGSLPAGSNAIGSVSVSNLSGANKDIVATEYRVIHATSGALLGEVVAILKIYDKVALTNSTIAINLTTMTELSSLPSLSNLVILGQERYAMTYAYDGSDNLVTETRTMGDFSQTRTYAYSSGGNLISRTAWV